MNLWCQGDCKRTRLISTVSKPIKVPVLVVVIVDVFVQKSYVKNCFGKNKIMSKKTKAKAFLIQKGSPLSIKNFKLSLFKVSKKKD